MRNYCLILSVCWSVVFSGVAYGVQVKSWTMADGISAYQGVMMDQTGNIIVPGWTVTAFSPKKNGIEFRTITKGFDDRFLIGTAGDSPFRSFDGTHFADILLQDDERMHGVSVIKKLEREKLIVAGSFMKGEIAVLAPGIPRFRLLCRLPAETVLDVLEADEEGMALVATSPPGQIFRVNMETGDFDLWAELPDASVRFLVRDGNKEICIGGGETGNLYRRDEKGRIEVVYHFPEESLMKAVLFDQGLLIAANRLRQAPADDTAEKYKEFFKHFSSLDNRYGTGRRAPELLENSAGQMDKYDASTVYFFNKDGQVDHLFSLDNEAVFDMAVDCNDGLYLATGPRGKLYNVVNPTVGERRISICQVTDYRYISALAMDNGRIQGFLAGDIASELFIRDVELQERYVMTSIFSSRVPAQWGRLSWQGQGISVLSRHGATPRPDSTWTDWLPRPVGENAEIGGYSWRYGQLKFMMNDSATLRDFRYAYVETNQRPKIDAVYVAKASHQSGGPAMEISWVMADPNDDPLEAMLYLRKDGDRRWVALQPGHPVTESAYLLNTKVLTDGYYQVRIEITDSPGNFENPLADAQISDVFAVDNTPPAWTEVGNSQSGENLRGMVADSFSPIKELSFRRADGSWQQFMPSDGIADELVEDISLDMKRNGSFPVMLRIRDSAGNETVVSVMGGNT